MQNLYLSKEENTALRLLSKGFSSSIVRREMNVHRVRWDHFTLRLRRKTGIANHKDERQCQEYLAKYAKASMVLSPEQVQILRRRMNGETIGGIAYLMRISDDDVRQLESDACAAIGIFTPHEPTRKLQYRTYLSVYHSTNGKPLTETELKALRLVAKGYLPRQVYHELGGNEQYFVKLIRSVCLRLGMNVQGRGTQRRMIQDYLARIDAQAMNDPMF